MDVGEGQHAMVQVKAVHPGSYIFMKKSTFALEPWVSLGLVVFDQNHESWPSLFLIPAEAWLNPSPLLVEREYQGKKSKPEYGLNIRVNWHQELAAWSATKAHIEAVLGAARRR
ncbi:MAG: hypothetical protein CK428_30960 [Mycobacterium sp.]|nr:MAG: hypothetical protein CK428_30960 [Mycobacterium sp.]